MRLLIILVCVSFLFSCNKKKEEQFTDLGYEYYPITLGKYIVYDVDSTVYDDFSGDTTYYKFRVKEKIEETYTDNEGQPAYKLVRYVKWYNPLVIYDNMPWVIRDVWSLNKTTTAVEVVEENVRYIKLTFPVKEERTWKGNSKNILQDWDYKYLSIDKSEIINTLSFDNVLTVEQKDDKLKNMVHREYYVEKYAKGVGLVSKEIKDLFSGTIQIGIPVEQRIEKGIVYKQTIVSYGQE